MSFFFSLAFTTERIDAESSGKDDIPPEGRNLDCEQTCVRDHFSLGP
jgi:hypothetical protein